MAKAKKLPSGSWRVQASFTDDQGTVHRASFTDASAKLAEAKAAMWRAGMIEKEENKKHAPLGDALDEYIETCRATGMSPATIRGYVSLRNTAYAGLIDKRVNQITVRDLQAWVNVRSKEVSPKSVRNALGLIQAATKQHEVRIDFSALRLPKPQRTEMEIPSDYQVAQLLDACYNDDDMYLAIALAALMGLRRSEICGLRWSDIHTNGDAATLTVDKALVMGEGGKHISKAPKTQAGCRQLVIPAALYDEIKQRRNLRPTIVSLTPNALSLKYTRLVKELDAPPRFHNLRHYHASVMLREGVPEKYIIADMGHSSFDMVKRVYGHVMSEKQSVINAAMDTHATVILNSHTASHTDEKKSNYC